MQTFTLFLVSSISSSMIFPHHTLKCDQRFTALYVNVIEMIFPYNIVKCFSHFTQHLHELLLGCSQTSNDGEPKQVLLLVCYSSW